MTNDVRASDHFCATCRHKDESDMMLGTTCCALTLVLISANSSCADWADENEENSSELPAEDILDLLRAVRDKRTHRFPDWRTISAAIDEIERLRTLINTPEVGDWLKGVQIEAAHQIEKWGPDHDAQKQALDWFWLIGYLAQKATDAALRADFDKARHHTITTGAALAQWFRHLPAAIGETEQ